MKDCTGGNGAAAETCSAPTGARAGEEFVELLTVNHRALFRFIYTLLPHQADAEDVLQRTSVTLWRKFEEFEPGTDFFRWAAQVARFKVLEFHRERARDRLQYWDDQLIDALARMRLESMDTDCERREALSKCLRKLSERDRELVQHRYSAEPHQSIKDLAEQLGRPSNTVYKALNRIYRALYLCIESSLTSAHMT